ncbi:unnamed protein product [Rotaria sordida]|uniref:G-protein coupled receptors family 1 profile domain-containing protein n=2 Tax=Rotaria sordida TaxID=392033 RepID=A0A815C4G8_9BILA|nr:unnamed protein product [Rotaria sordida]CAF1322657.1 unnamed protein product [Rotaria sordida]CAF3728787.1 unnamed protein product [Rotaria sordida]CAF3843277.1 unnamed protein product [Rotaria sordida]
MNINNFADPISDTKVGGNYSIYDSLDSCNNYLCQLRGYFIHVFICSFYYSYVLQAIFRLFRIVFYKKKNLQSYYIFLIGIFFQWLISFLYILIHLLKNNFEYSLFAHSCWISFKNIYELLHALLIMYICPILIVCLIYIYIIRYTHQTIHIQQQRQIRNKRDLIILKRMVIIILIAMGIGIVTLFTWINYIITNYLIPIAYHLQGLSISSGFLMGSIGFAFITPQIYDILRIKQRQINPIIMIEVIH